MPKFKSAKGFTLLETGMVIFFLVLLLSVFFSIFIWHNSVYHYQESLVSVSEEGRNTMAALQLNVNQAYRVLSSVVINGTTYTSATTTLALQLPAIDSSGNVVASKWDNAVFFLTGSQLSEIISNDPASSRRSLQKKLGSNIQSLSFTYNNATFNLVTQVNVTFTSQINYKGHLFTDNLQQNLYLENYY